MLCSKIEFYSIVHFHNDVIDDFEQIVFTDENYSIYSQTKHEKLPNTALLQGRQLSPVNEGNCLVIDNKGLIEVCNSLTSVYKKYKRYKRYGVD